MKRPLLLLFLIAVLCYKPAAQSFSDAALLNQLNLTAEQKTTLKTIIKDYKTGERKRRNELRRKLYGHLTIEQQNKVKQWWRRKYKQHKHK